MNRFLMAILMMGGLLLGFLLWVTPATAEAVFDTGVKPDVALLKPMPNRNPLQQVLTTITEEPLAAQSTTVITTTTVRRSRSVNSQPLAADPRLELLKHIPQLIGVSQPRTYLVLIQNNDELRGTGGFISAIGRLTLHRGKIVSFTIEDSYAIDDFSQPYPDAPEPLFRFMKAEIWLARDANWSPDFPTSAQNFIDLYRISRKVDIDGVIAVDQFALQHVIEVFEPVHVPNWSEPAMGSNVINLIRQSWSPQADEVESQAALDIWWKNRKGFINELIKALQQQVEQNPVNINWLKLVNTAFNVMERRHVQVWLTDPTLQAFFQMQGWDGAIQPSEGDFLMVVETNLGFNKANAVVKTEMLYAVDLTDREAGEALLTVSHHNKSKGEIPCNPAIGYGRDYWSLIDRCYWNYLRIYSHADSQLLDATPHPVPAQSLLRQQPEPAQVEVLSETVNKTVWGTFLMVPHRKMLETSFRYTLPRNVVQSTKYGQHYHLDVQKQAGTWANDLQVSIRLPKNAKLISAVPPPTQMDNNLLMFRLSLQTDQQIDVIFR